MKTFFKLSILSIVLLLISCSKKEGELNTTIDDEFIVTVEDEINFFIWRGLNLYYLWQEDVADLDDDKFKVSENTISLTELYTFFRKYNSPEETFENLLNRPTDRFSVIVDDYVDLENSFQGLNLSTGMEFGLVRYRDTPSNIFGYVRYVVPNSSAATNNVARGQIFNSVDGQQLTENNAFALLFGSNTSFSIGLVDYNNGNPTANGIAISLNKTEVQENPIAVAKVITEGTQKIGYVMYNQFASNFDAQLNAVFADFKAENIDNLIVDLRYNPGGFVSSATYLGGMITGQFNGQLFSKNVWNSKVMNAFPADNFTNNFRNEIRNTDSNGNVILQENLNSLGLTKVYFITSNASASASELVINALSAYIDVRVIGTTTTGKQEGSITLYDSEGFSKTGANLKQNHTYAMQPIVFEISNKDGVNYRNGIVPDSEAFPGVFLPENFGNLGVLGERSDPLLNETLNYISTNAKTTEKSYKNIRLKEIYHSKLAYPSKDNMIVDLK
ncbi:S41 family peptidase [Polaribacter sp.]|uniref:S41 family peptidase n=1 Tax=Polaribacter sp. TaxID=1920175 RepID=UPI003F6D68EB